MFDDAGRAAYINAMIMCAQGEIEAMKSANEHAKHVGNAPVYNFDDFEAVAPRLGITHNQVVEFLRAGR